MRTGFIATAICAALTGSTAFATTLQPPHLQHVQQTPADPVTPAPQQMPHMQHAPAGLLCTSPRARLAMRAFVENYNSAQGALHDSRFADAVAFADAAGPHATDAAQWAAIENLRIAAFTRSGNFSAALQALDALAALDCQEAAKIQDMRDSILKQMPLELEPN